MNPSTVNSLKKKASSSANTARSKGPTSAELCGESRRRPCSSLLVIPRFFVAKPLLPVQARLDAAHPEDESRDDLCPGLAHAHFSRDKTIKRVVDATRPHILSEGESSFPRRDATRSPKHPGFLHAASRPGEVGGNQRFEFGFADDAAALSSAITWFDRFDGLEARAFDAINWFRIGRNHSAIMCRPEVGIR